MEKINKTPTPKVEIIYWTKSDLVDKLLENSDIQRKYFPDKIPETKLKLGRNQVIEIIRDFLTPTIEDLRVLILYLWKFDYTWDTGSKYMKNFNKISASIHLSIYNLFIEEMKIKEHIDNFNSIHD